MEKQMTKMTFMSAALIAATALATQAMAAGSDVPARHSLFAYCVILGARLMLLQSEPV